jgi:hypothetical protein
MIYVYKILYFLMPLILVVFGTIFWEQYFYWEDQRVERLREVEDKKLQESKPEEPSKKV